MPEGGAVRWSPAQQSMLRELGCELFTVRGAEPGSASASVNDAPSTPDARASASPIAGLSGAVAASASPRAAAPTRDAHAEGARRDPDAGLREARPRRTLVVLSPDANWLRGPHARLARGLLAALGIRDDEVRGEPVPGAPTLAFEGAPAAPTDALRAPGVVVAPALHALRDARAKRALWPALRALRRRLREGTPG